MQCYFSLHTILSNKVTAKKAKTQQREVVLNKKNTPPRSRPAHTAREPHPAAPTPRFRPIHTPSGTVVVFFQIPPLFVLQIENFHYLCTVEKGAYPKGGWMARRSVDAPTKKEAPRSISGSFFDGQAN